MKNFVFRGIAASAALAAALLLTPGTAAAQYGTSKPAAKAEAKNIVETAVAAGQFNTLAAALEAAGLVETLASGGPFTVFAPTDEAFAKVPKPVLTALLEDKETLTKILLAHVVEGNVMAADAVKLTSAKTVGGAEIPVSATDGVKVGGASVVKTDIKASNGVIHVIDGVIVPKGVSLPAANIVEAAVAAGSFKTLATALTEAGLVETLKSGEGPFTVFAPTDEAFAKLPAGTLDGLLKDKEALKKVLLFHVVDGRVNSGAVVGLKEAKTLSGATAKIEVADGKVKVAGANVVKTDIQTGNGVIHVIDTVMLPPN